MVAQELVYDKIIAGKYGKIAHILSDCGTHVYLVYRKSDYTAEEWARIASGNFRFTLEAKEDLDVDR